MNIIGFDIETDTTPLSDQEREQGLPERGLDPRHTAVTSVAMDDGVTLSVIRGDELTILNRLSARMQVIRPDVTIVTWNGAVFDFPFLESRYLRHGLKPWFDLVPNPDIVPKYQPVPGHAGGYDVRLGENRRHVDVAYLAQPSAVSMGVSWSLKPYAQALGLATIELDRPRLHAADEVVRNAYNASDATVTRQIALRFWRKAL